MFFFLYLETGGGHNWGDRKIMIHRSDPSAVRGFQNGGGGEISNIIVSNATRPEWPRLRRIGSRAGSNGKFFRGAQARLKGPGIRAEKKI